MKRRGKFAGRAGFTLVEMMATLLILGLVSMVVAEGMGVAVPVFHDIVKAANAQTALSANLSALRGELTTAHVRSISGDKRSITYTIDGREDLEWRLETRSVAEAAEAEGSGGSSGPGIKLIWPDQQESDLVSSYVLNKNGDQKNYHAEALFRNDGGLLSVTVSIIDNNNSGNVVAGPAEYLIRVLGGIDSAPAGG